MICVDLDLARRLEAIETWVATQYGLARLALWPEKDSAVVEVAGGVACYLGEGSFLNEARGMGLNGPVSGDDLDTVERVFFERGSETKIHVNPMADPSLLEGLGVRGYRAVGFEDVLFREMDGSETFPGPPEGIALSRTGAAEEVVIAGDVLARGFSAPDEPSPGMREIFEMSSQVEGLVGLLAKVGEEPAGSACVLIRDGQAMLCGASTLPSFRNRGIQTALLHARLALISASGCRIVQFGALPGTSSHRNAERVGFRVAYTKAMLQKEPS